MIIERAFERFDMKRFKVEPVIRKQENDCMKLTFGKINKLL